MNGGFRDRRAGDSGIPRASEDMIITTHMDHPAGQFGAADSAALHPAPRWGLLTHVLCEKNEFIERLPDRTGTGSDDLLEWLVWKKLG